MRQQDPAFVNFNRDESVFATRRFEYHMPNQWLKKAETEVGETPSLAKRNIAILRAKVLADSNIFSRVDDHFLLSFLRCRKHNVDKAYQAIKNYYDMKQKYPNLAHAGTVGETLKVYELNAHTVLDDKDDSGRPVFWIRAAFVDVFAVTVEQMLPTMMATMEHLILDPVTQVTGVVLVFDMGDFSIHQARLFTPKVVGMLMNILQDVFPCKMKAIHFLNQPILFNAIFALFRPFLKDKLKKRIHFHGKNFERFYSHIKPEILPEEYNGTKGKFSNIRLRKAVEANDEIFEEMRIYGNK